MLQMQPLRMVYTELSIRTDRGKRTLKVEVTAQSLHTDPGECSRYGTHDDLSDRIFKRDRLDCVFLSQNPVLLGEILNPECREAALLQECVQLLKLWEDRGQRIGLINVGGRRPLVEQ